MSLWDIAHEITYGNWSGTRKTSFVKELDGKAAVEALVVQGSGADFFNLDADGNDLD